MKKTCAIYDYLHSTGVLAASDDAAICEAKRAYWKQYKAAWRKKQREQSSSHTIILTPAETKYISDLAAKHKRSITAFLKASALAYQRQHFIIPDILLVNGIRELLLQNYLCYRKLFEESVIPYQDGKEILKRHEAMEERIMQSLYYPQSIEMRITEAIRQNPGYRETVIDLLKIE